MNIQDAHEHLRRIASVNEIRYCWSCKGRLNRAY